MAPMYQYPPLSITVNSAALIVGTIGPINVLAAPGAGLAYRVVGANATLANGVAAATLIHGLMQDTTALWQIRFGFGGGGSLRTYDANIPGPGLQTASNTAITYSIASTAAGSFIFLTLFYYIDALV